MNIHGEFINQRGERIAVHIKTASGSRNIEIGGDSGEILFTANPVEIRSESNDLFDVLRTQSAQINLYSKQWLPELFSTAVRSGVVNVYVDNACVFAGFIEPQIYSQPYNEIYDEISINCIDALSALEHSKYKNVGMLGHSYGGEKQGANYRNYQQILLEILNEIGSGLDIVGGKAVAIYYDKSKSLKQDTDNIFEQIMVSELLFFGKSESDMWTKQEVLTEMLRYLNLHIVQHGFSFYIFSWESLQSSSPLSFRNIVSGGDATIGRELVTISNKNVSDCGAQISLSEAYNRITISCETDAVEDLIDSPFDQKLLNSNGGLSLHRKALTEYSSHGDGVSARDAFKNMVTGAATDYDAASITDWYVKVLNSAGWSFLLSGNMNSGGFQSGELLNVLLKYLSEGQGAALLSIGSVKRRAADNSMAASLNEADYLVLAVNGNGERGVTGVYPSAKDILLATPYVTYEGNSQVVLSPSDDETTNYVIFSGSMVLNPRMKQTASYSGLVDVLTNGSDQDKLMTDIVLKNNVVYSRENDKGRYYTRKYWRYENEGNKPIWWKASPVKTEPQMGLTWDYQSEITGFVPYTGEGDELFEYSQSILADATDRCSKLPVLCCMLIVGDKCVVETKADGGIDSYEWRSYKERSKCSSDEEYYAQSFTLGIDPKIGDKIVGRSFDIQNNIPFDLGIEGKGTAIPIRKRDQVSGKVEFKILGPFNILWEKIAYIHPIYWQIFHKTSENSIPLLAQLSNIMIKSFDIKTASDNALRQSGRDADNIVYSSRTKDSFVHEKDDITFKIHSALTAEERAALGVRNAVWQSVPQDKTTGVGLLRIYDRNLDVTAKPEQLYVSSYYRALNKPTVELSQNLYHHGGGLLFAKHYRHEALGKELFVQGYGMNLMSGTVQLKLREI